MKSVSLFLRAAWIFLLSSQGLSQDINEKPGSFVVSGDPVKELRLVLDITPLDVDDTTDQAALNDTRTNLEIKIGSNEAKPINLNPGSEGENPDAYDTRFVATVNSSVYQEISPEDSRRRLAVDISLVDQTSNNSLNELFKPDKKVTVFLTYNEGTKLTLTLTELAAFPAALPNAITVVGKHQNITISWQSAAKITYNNFTAPQDSEFAPPQVNAWMIDVSANTNDYSLAGSGVSASGEIQAVEERCEVQTDGNSCSVVCPTENTFLKSNATPLFSAAADSQGNISFSALEPQENGEPKNFAVIVAYSRGFVSSCFLASPRLDVTLSEFNGLADKVKEGNPNCFIATAAYGSPMASQVDLLRWFRDEYLLRFDWGQAFVDTYYKYSPPVANIVAQNEYLKSGVRFFLGGAILLIGLVQNYGILTVLMFLLGILFLTMGSLSIYCLRGRSFS